METGGYMDRTSKTLAAFSVVLFGFLSPVNSQTRKIRNVETRDAVVKSTDQTPPPLAGLQASGPLPGLAEKLRLFGQFVGDWELDSVITKPDGSKLAGKGEWHFGWVLEGRAIQDVFILRAPDAKAGTPAASYGTTLRIYDPKIDGWRVVYASAMAGTLETFVARQIGDEIVLEPKDGGPMYRWIFSEITPSSFHWRSVGSPDGGKTWHVFQEVSVRRRAGKLVRAQMF
jgi:hypothetical protein